METWKNIHKIWTFKVLRFFKRKNAGLFRQVLQPRALSVDCIGLSYCAQAGILRSSLLACGRADLADYVAAKHEETSQQQLMHAAKGAFLTSSLLKVFSSLVSPSLSLSVSLSLSRTELTDHRPAEVLEVYG